MVDAAVAARSEQDHDGYVIRVNGKLVDQRRNDGLFYSTILAPAPDEYSQPMPFEVRSAKQLGSRNEVVSVECRVGGYFRRSYDTKPDPHTGEVRRVRPIVLTLDALAA